MTVTPLHDRIVVARIENSDSLPGAIVIPDSAKEKSQRGTSWPPAIGRFNDHVRTPFGYHRRRHRAVRQVCPSAVTLDAIEYLMMKEDDVLAVEASGRKPAAGHHLLPASHHALPLSALWIHL